MEAEEKVVVVKVVEETAVARAEVMGMVTADAMAEAMVGERVAAKAVATAVAAAVGRCKCDIFPNFGCVVV